MKHARCNPGFARRLLAACLATTVALPLALPAAPALANEAGTGEIGRASCRERV